MKHATRINALARQAGGAVFNIAHGAVLSLGLMGMTYVANESIAPLAVSYEDTFTIVKTAPTVGEAALAGIAAAPTQPALVAPHKPPQGLSVQGRHSASAVVAALGTPGFDPENTDDGALSPEMARVRDWVSETYRVSDKVLEPALLAAEESAEEHGIDPLLIVAIMAVESSFNHRAVSSMGAQGLMQVIPHYHQDKIGKRRDKYALFDPELNVRVGTLVLREGLQRYGSTQRALQYYNGALKDPNARYSRKVLAFKKRLLAAVGREALVRTEAPASAG